MKKYLYILAIILAFANSSYAMDESEYYDLETTSEYLQEQKFFESPASLMMPEVKKQKRDYTDYAFERRAGGSGEYSEIDPDNMPVFKRVRLSIQHKISTKVEERERRLEENKDNQKPLLEKIKFWKKSDDTAQDLTESEKLLLTEKGSIADSIQNEIANEEDSSDAIALESGIATHVTEKELVLDSDKITYDEDSGDMVAHGRPVLDFPQQGLKVLSDTMLYNQDSNILKGYGNVVILKSGMPTTADSFEIDMNEETMLMSNISSVSNDYIMDAEKAIQKESKLFLENGYLHSDISKIQRFHSRMIGPRFWDMIVEPEAQALFLTNPSGNDVRLDIDEVYVDARKNHNKYIAKNIKVSKDGKHRFSWKKMTIFTDKEGGNFEANYPEFGTKRNLGMFIGPGFVFGGPGGSVMKAIPLLNYKNDEFGIGGLLKYKNTYNSTFLGYGTAGDIFILKGRQRLDDNIFLQYTANTYNDEWFLGARMPKYGAEIFYDKKYSVNDFLAEGKNLSFRHRFGVGLMENADRNRHGEKLGGGNMATTRFRYMAEISQSLYSYENEDENLFFNLSFAMQGSAAVYGTGDTQFIGRMGPRVHLQYKRWMQDIAYFQTAYEDESPLPRYDAYRYGSSSVYISEIFRINKYLSVGWSGLANLSDDSPNGDIFQENRFVIAVGPEDLRIRFGYDFYRRTTFFGFDLAFDTKGTSVTYKKMEIKNPERLGKNKERALAFSPAQKPVEQEVSNKRFGRGNKSEASKVLQYAQVINIEDPSKETID